MLDAYSACTHTHTHEWDTWNRAVLDKSIIASQSKGPGRTKVLDKIVTNIIRGRKGKKGER